MYTAIYRKDNPDDRWMFYDDEDPSIVKAYTIGCGCCSEKVDLTPELCDEYLLWLQDRIKEVKQIKKLLNQQNET